MNELSKATLFFIVHRIHSVHISQWTGSFFFLIWGRPEAVLSVLIFTLLLHPSTYLILTSPSPIFTVGEVGEDVILGSSILLFEESGGGNTPEAVRLRELTPILNIENIWAQSCSFSIPAPPSEILSSFPLLT